MLGIEDMVDEIRQTLADELMATYKAAALVGVTQVGAPLAPITDQIDAQAVAYAQQRGAELITDLAGTTVEDLRDLLGEAVASGMSPADLSDAIESMGSFGEARADTIARTELAFAHVNGNVDGWRATGEVDAKQSILGDLHEIDDECDDCANAGTVKLDDDFVPGYDFPPYHPNCVCDVLPVLVAPFQDTGD